MKYKVFHKNFYHTHTFLSLQSSHRCKILMIAGCILKYIGGDIYKVLKICPDCSYRKSISQSVSYWNISSPPFRRTIPFLIPFLSNPTRTLIRAAACKVIGIDKVFPLPSWKTGVDHPSPGIPAEDILLFLFFTAAERRRDEFFAESRRQFYEDVDLRLCYARLHIHFRGIPF